MYTEIFLIFPNHSIKGVVISMRRSKLRTNKQKRTLSRKIDDTINFFDKQLLIVLNYLVIVLLSEAFKKALELLFQKL